MKRTFVVGSQVSGLLLSETLAFVKAKNGRAGLQKVLHNTNLAGPDLPHGMWYPMEMLDLILDRASKLPPAETHTIDKIGHFSSRNSPHLREIVVRNGPEMFLVQKRSDIRMRGGEFRSLSPEPGVIRLELEGWQAGPHFCQFICGRIQGLLSMMEVRFTISEPECASGGDSLCAIVFEYTSD